MPCYFPFLPDATRCQEEKKSPEKENPIWVLLKGFGQKLHKQQDEGKDPGSVELCNHSSLL